MANVDASTLKPVETPAEDDPVAAKTILEEPMEPTATTATTNSMSKTSSVQSTTFHVPALVGRPNAGKASLRQRPVLMPSNPQVRKTFTLIMYVMLIGQVAIVALTAFAITMAILSPGWLPNEIGPSDIYWMPGYPVNVLMLLLPVWFCTTLSFVGLSCARGALMMRRFLFVVATLATGISLGLLAYLENAFAMIFIGIVLMSLVVATLGIALNFVSFVASWMGPIKPKASKMEVMARTSCLTGTEKFICLLNDEEAANTRAALVLAGFSWIIATVTVALIVFVSPIHDIELAPRMLCSQSFAHGDRAVYHRVGRPYNGFSSSIPCSGELEFYNIGWLPFFFAAIAACPALIYFTYGVEKQVRRCMPEEREKAMVNLSVDFLFFVAGCITLDLSIISWQELGTAKPCPVEKGVSQFVMKQVSSTTTRSTSVSTSTSRSPRHRTENRNVWPWRHV